ncbi:hypothetical protein BH10PSE14_BH10PSE14_19790 [soil metagenome]
MRSEGEVDTTGTPVRGPLAVYLGMLDAHAADDVENASDPAIPVGHVFWLAPIALIVLVLARSEILALAIVVGMLLWVLGASGYYWRAYRRHRIAMGLPAGSPKRYWLRQGSRIVVFTAIWLCMQVLLRHFF